VKIKNTENHFNKTTYIYIMQQRSAVADTGSNSHQEDSL